MIVVVDVDAQSGVGSEDKVGVSGFALCMDVDVRGVGAAGGVVGLVGRAEEGAGAAHEVLHGVAL